MDRALNLATQGGSGVTVLGGVSKAVSSDGNPLKLEAGEDGKDIKRVYSHFNFFVTITHKCYLFLNCEISQNLACTVIS